MIPVPPGWQLQRGIDMFTVIAPEGPAAGMIKYRENNVPIHRLGRLVEQQLAASPLFVTGAIQPPRRLLTREGEHAALVEITGHEAEVPALRVMGFVFADTFYAITSGLVTEAPCFDRLRAMVNDLLLEDGLGLGVRRRRFEYTPPAAWQPVPRDLVTEWFPPGFPDDLSMLTTYPATPRQLDGARIFDAEVKRMVAFGWTVVATTPPEATTGQGSLRGKIFRARFEHVAKQTREAKTMAVLEDDHYTYPIDLSVHHEDRQRHQDVLQAVIASVNPIPPGAQTPRWSMFADLWSE